MITKAIDFSKSNYEAHLKDLFDFLKIKTISSDQKYANELVVGAKWLASFLEKMGAQAVKILDTQKHPVVFGELLCGDSQKPTILIYGHYDVQPADPINLWNSDPFSPTIENNLLFARGASDMKGQMMIVLAAIKSIQATSGLPVNFKFMFEGEEEIGSPSIQSFLSTYKDLFKCDFVLNLDAGMISKDKPTIVYGLRGLAYFEIHIKGPAQDLHSGLFGGVVYNPIQALVEMLAGMKNEQGVIQLPGFYKDVQPLSPKERIELEKLGLDEAFYKSQTGVNFLYGETGFSPVEQVGARPTLDVNGIFGGYTGEGPKTVIPANASAKISMRLVPNQTPEKVNEQLIAYFKNHAPKEVSWDIKMLSSDTSSLTDMDFYATKCFAKSIENIWGRAPVYERGGGSIPIVSHMQKILNAESVLSGFSLPEDNIHSPNERLDLDIYKKGIETVIHFIYQIGDHCEDHK